MSEFLTPVIPLSFKLLANEISKLGEQFIIRTIRDHCLKDEEDKISCEIDQGIFEMDSLVTICRMLGYECVITDQLDLKTWLDYKDLTVRPPAQMQTLRSKVYIDTDGFIREL